MAKETYQVSVKKIHVKRTKTGKGGRDDTYIVVKTPDGIIGLNTNTRSGVSFYQLPGKRKPFKVQELAGQRINAAGVLDREGKKGTIEHYKQPLVKKDMTAIAKGLRLCYEPQPFFKGLFKRKKKRAAAKA